MSFTFQDARRMTEGSGGIATAKTRRTKTADGRGRESGRESWVNAMTLTTGTKQSTGIAEATTRTPSHLKAASSSSALDKVSHLPHPGPVILQFFLLQPPPQPHTLFFPPLNPLCGGVAATCMIWTWRLCISGIGHIQPPGFGSLWTL